MNQEGVGGANSFLGSKYLPFRVDQRDKFFPLTEDQEVQIPSLGANAFLLDQGEQRLSF